MTQPSGSEVDPDLAATDVAARYLHLLRAFAARRLRDAAAAEDAAQETLRRVLEALRQGRVRDLQALPSFTFEDCPARVSAPAPRPAAQRDGTRRQQD